MRLFGEPTDEEPGSVRPQDLGALLKHLRHQRSSSGRGDECTRLFGPERAPVVREPRPRLLAEPFAA
jgi:hypothetical protein